MDRNVVVAPGFLFLLVSWVKNQKTYAQMCTNLDSEVGRIMATLDSLGLTEKTRVIFSSDEGPRSEPSSQKRLALKHRIGRIRC